MMHLLGPSQPRGLILPVAVIFGSFGADKKEVKRTTKDRLLWGAEISDICIKLVTAQSFHF